MTPAQLELVTMICPHCQFHGVPTLMRSSHHSRNDALGAHCGRCKRWLKWVRQTSEWLALERDQQTDASNAAPAIVEHDVNCNTRTPNPPGVPCNCRARASLDLREQPRTATDVARESDWIAALASMQSFCYDQAEASGFHDGRVRYPLELCMLVVTELAELAEAARKNKLDAPSDHIPEFTYAEEEWADVLIRVFDHSHDHVDPIRLGQAFVAKLAFNRTRGYRHGGKTI